MKITFLPFAGALLCGALLGQSLVKDIAPGAGTNPSSSPGTGILLGGIYLFPASDGVTGTELWRTDGTAAGTRQVRDINPGSGSSSPGTFTVFGGAVYFAANDGLNGTELWRSDGTAVGTVLLKDCYPGTSSSTPTAFAVSGGTLFFTALDSTATTGTGRELWKSDGTAAGTVLVKDINPGTASGSPSGLIDLGGVLLFAANDGTTGSELWKSDGTAAGTLQVLDISSGTGSGSPRDFTVLGAKAFFVATESQNGTELWSTDGTTGGTALVADINAGTGSSSPSTLTAFAGALFFSANTAATGRELFRSDGTLAGTGLFLDINPGTGTSIELLGAGLFQVAGAKMFFSAVTPAAGGELWSTDGTVAGTAMVVDLTPGASYSNFGSLLAVGPLVYFDHFDAVTGIGRELWLSNGTAGGTVLVRDINVSTPTASSNPSGFAAAGARVYFSATDGINGTELWLSDGTLAGTNLVADIALPLPASSGPANFTTVGGLSFFTANDGVSGIEPWVTDGTAAGTLLLRDIYPGVSSSSPTFLATYQGELYFSALDSTASTGLGRELWKTDGTPAGTVLVADLNPGSASSSPSNAAVFAGRLFFSASNGTTAPGVGTELFVTDGTAAGTALVKDLYPGTSSSSPQSLTVYAGLLYFTALDGTATTGTGRELWRTDGTTAGTTLVADLNPGTGSGAGSSTAVLGGKLYFAGGDAATGIELAVSDGTAAGTSVVKDLYPGTSSSTPAGLTVFQGALLFNALDGTATTGTGRELYRSDGTAAGTVLLRDIFVGTSTGVSSSVFVATPNLVFFAANDGSTGTELWVTDGTSAGTVQAADVRVGPLSGISTVRIVPAGSGDAVVFQADDGVSGVELWWSDGTAVGTGRIFDLNPGLASAAISGFGRLGTTILLGGNDGVAGVELFKFPLSLVGASLVENVGRGCPGTGGLVPQMVAGGGLPVLGNAGFTVGVTNANVSAPCTMFVSAAINPTPVGGGCVFYTVPALISLNTSTNAAGNASIPVAIPNVPAYAGVELAFQYVVLDPNGAYFNLVSLSDALRILIGN
ncbi:MAG: hypothetical protein IT458_20475 [Planctomycetes bacterium]|nr:hypothetical protein [Planctomycetota bacterium]